MKRCTKCVLPETFPGISFNEAGVCNFCQAYKGQEYLEAAKQKYKQKFETLLEQYKNRSDYDCLMAYSGGKDSTYTLHILKNRYKLNILAFTFDNGFISPVTIENIRNVMDNLGIDHILMKARFDLLRKVFVESSKSELYSRKALERASTICTTCMGLVKFISLKITLEKNIPFIGYGWSPGQAPISASIFKNNPGMIKNMQQAIQRPLYKLVGKEINHYFLNEADFNGDKDFPYNISPLAFLEDYNESVIFSTIKKLGWKEPQDTDANSTNCLLNSYGIVIHKKRFNFHPYAYEMAKLVREGYLDRTEALARLEAGENPQTLEYVYKRLAE